jgi:hypothetical protein
MTICLEPIQFAALLHLQHRTDCARQTPIPAPKLPCAKLTRFGDLDDLRRH